jgi:hypothetical protein
VRKGKDAGLETGAESWKFLVEMRNFVFGKLKLGGRFKQQKWGREQRMK